MKNFRIIPRLDIKGPNLVKGVKLEGLRVLGDPATFAQYYYENGADELYYQDVVASLYDRNSLGDIISSTAKKSFIPLTVGGGIRTVEDIKSVLRLGADKVCINTGAIRNPSFISEAVKKFGSSTIVVSIECIKQSTGEYFAFTDNGREYTGVEVVEWAKKLEELGSGEIVVTAVDRDGTGDGFDLELLELITSSISIPVIAHGGAGKMEDVLAPIQIGKVDAVCIASVIHYKSIQDPIFTAYEKNFEGNHSYLKSKKIGFGKIEPTSILEIKRYLNSNGIKTRI
jgi:cyclase